MTPAPDRPPLGRDEGPVFHVEAIHLMGSGSINEDTLLVRACIAVASPAGGGGADRRLVTEAEVLARPLPSPPKTSRPPYLRAAVKDDDLGPRAQGRASGPTIASGLFGVFDGASRLEGSADLATTTATPGALASSIVRDSFLAAFESGAHLVDAALEANRALQAQMVRRGVDVASKLDRWGTTAAVVRIGEDTLEWLSIGDSRILIVRSDGTFELVGELTAGSADHDLQALSLMKSGASTDVVREAERRAALRANIDYGLLNGEDAAAAFVRTGRRRIERKAVRQSSPRGGHDHHDGDDGRGAGRELSGVLIFTDGCILPRPDPARAPEWDTMVRLYAAGGLTHLVSAVRAAEAADPDRALYPRFKIHDDMAAIALSAPTDCGTR